MRKLLISLAIAIPVSLGIYSLYEINNKPVEIYQQSYTNFLSKVKNNVILKVKIKAVNLTVSELSVIDKFGDEYKIFIPTSDKDLFNDLFLHNVDVSVIPPESRNIILDTFFNLLPPIIIVGAMIYIYRKQNPQRLGFGKPAAKLLERYDDNTKFDDIAGCDNEKRELCEVVDFLKNPEKYSKLGGTIPKGVLLSGPSGTGKTTLGKAVANEAGVPFYYCSGSSFVEIYVGQGAAKVRELFSELRKHEKCVLFIDECDSISKQRSTGLNSNDERDNTLNALLSEMDGIDTSKGIIIIGATNLPNVLDKAFLRPGRFDRQIEVGLPDVKGREKILEIHTKNVPLHENISLLEIAKRTTGFTGAELKNLVNEAAIFAARENENSVNTLHFDSSLDKILMGTEKSSSIMNDEEKKQTAFHEVGHFFVGALSEEHDKAYKISIRPRTNSLGVTIFRPEKDFVSLSKKKLESQIATLLAGRVAEELYSGMDYVTTGCSQDYARATQLATKMVTEWGMSPSLPPMVFVERDSFSGEFKFRQGVDNTNDKVEKEIEKILTRNYNKAKKILKTNWKKVIEIADILYEKEDLDVKDIQYIMDRP